jgi:CubicO group peptidase (beta-lactamase class C family)
MRSGTLGCAILLSGIGFNAVAAIDGTSLAALEQRISTGEIAGIHGVVISQGGETVAEWYFAGDDETILQKFGRVEFTPDTLHDIRSITKSVISMLFGIAVAEGAIKDLDTPVQDYFPEYPELRTPERLRIRLRDILTMTSGLHWDERTYPYTDPRNSEIAMDIAPEPNRYALSQAIDTMPGKRWLYSGGDVALAGAIIARAVHTPLERYAEEELFKPLGIRYEWSMNRGIPRAASGLRLTPRDLTKLGGLMLNDGRYGGRQIVPAEWVQASITRHANVDPDPVCGTGYGYLWWLGPGCETSPPTPWFAGFGNGGQRLFVVPSRDLVVVITAGLYDDPRQFAVPAEVFAAVLAAVAP